MRTNLLRLWKGVRPLPFVDKEGGHRKKNDMFIEIMICLMHEIIFARTFKMLHTTEKDKR